MTSTRLSRGLLGGACLAALLGAALVPLRHRARLERSAGNPVQRIALDSRSLLGLRRPAWGAAVQGGRAWGSAREGFFLAPGETLEVQVRAWPSFRQAFCLEPISLAATSASPADEGDREAFRTWFVALLEHQLERPSPAWEPAQRDCAGLLRFAFREAWGPHTEAWRVRVGFEGSPAAGEVRRAFGGPWRKAFLTRDGWRPFADGANLRDQSCVLLGRDPALGRPGDLLFFHRVAHSQPDHAMAFVRPDVDGTPVLIYHTGPEGVRGPGEVRRVRLDELLHHPDPEFRPLPENPAFLGVCRWKLLDTSFPRS